MRCLALGFTLVLAAAPAFGQAPLLKRGQPYAEARTSLLALGWIPAELPATFCEDGRCGLVRCLADDPRCAGRPETEICRGTGTASCQFLWRRRDALVEVRTIGEDDPVVANVRCRAGC